MTSATPFDKIYDTELKPALQTLEAERLRIRNRMIVFYALLGGAFITVFIGFTGNMGLAAVIFGISCVVLATITYFIFAPLKERYTSEFKEKVIRPVIGLIDPGFDYSPGDWIGEAEYKNSGLYLDYTDRCKGDDLVSGVYGRTQFSFSEVHSEKEEGSGKNRRTVTIFKGLFFIADFNKRFTSRTYVWSEEKPQLSILSKLFSSFADGLEKVKLESPEFERRFIVYSNDQVEARYILTPSMMERMVLLQDQMNATVVFSFVDTKVYIAIPFEQDMFEPSVFSPASYELITFYYSVIREVLNMIDTLDLNLRLWNKE